MAMPQQFMTPYNQNQPQAYNPANAYNGYASKKKNFGQNLYNTLFGTPEGLQQIPTATANQGAAREYATQFGLNALQNPQQGFEPIAGYARRNFQQQTLPDILERLTSLGGHGQASLSSPAIQSQLGAAGGDLDAYLAMLMSQYGQQQQQTGLQALDFGDRSQFQYMNKPGSEGIIGGAWNRGKEYAPLLAQAGLMYATGGASGAPGVSNLISQLAGKHGFGQ